MTNFILNPDNSNWRIVKIRRLLPACVSQAHESTWSPIELVDAVGECVIKAAVWEGCFIRMDHLRQLCGSWRLELNSRKLILAKNLVEHLFPDASEKEKAFMIRKIQYPGNPRLGTEAAKVLELVAAMDVENAQEWSKIKALARQKIQR